MKKLILLLIVAVALGWWWYQRSPVTAPSDNAENVSLESPEEVDVALGSTDVDFDNELKSLDAEMNNF